MSAESGVGGLLSPSGSDWALLLWGQLKQSSDRTTHTSYRALTGQGIFGISCKFERLILGKICAKLISVSDTLTQNQGDIY